MLLDSTWDDDGYGMVMECARWGKQHVVVAWCDAEKFVQLTFSNGEELLFGGSPHVKPPGYCIEKVAVAN
jgi:hypothetical protein